MRHLTALAALGFAGLALAACQTTPAPQALDLRGTEPFWAVRIRGGTLTLLRPEAAELTAQATPRSGAAGETTWTGRTADGRTLTATVRPGACSDGMSDTRYPMSATVSLSGEETMRGCAQPAA